MAVAVVSARRVPGACSTWTPEYVQTFAWRLRGARTAPMEMVREMQRQTRDAYESVARGFIASDCF